MFIITYSEEIMKEERCLFCFLSSYYQKEIMKLSQFQEEKFEDILERYHRIFLANLTVALEKPICKKHNHILHGDAIVSIFKNNKVLIKKLDTFFKNLIEIYTFWISGEAYSAIEKLNKILKSNNLLKKEDFNIREYLFFRGRKNVSNILNKYDMFHIPYDKRYLVGNQRFSLSGFPLLYLSLSLSGIRLELDIDEKKLDEYSISCFHFNNRAKIYSLDNPFRIYYQTQKIIKEPSISKKDLEENLLKLVLTSACLFEKRNSHKLQEKKGINIFYEEYILPQALTQVLKLNKYNGIFYPSTKIFNTLEEDLFNINNFNMAYFPIYNSQRHYDAELFKSLDISVPINFSEEIFRNIRENFDFNFLNNLFKKVKNDLLQNLSKNIKKIKDLSELNSMGIVKFNYLDKIYEDYCNFKSKYDEDDKILSFESLIIYKKIY